MGYGLKDLAADIATGGAYSITETTASAIAATEVATEVASNAARKAAGLPAAVAGKDASCCAKYQINGMFLLETHTGRVWRFDQQKDVFVPVQKKLSPLDWEILNDDIAQKLATVKATMSPAQLAGAANQLQAIGVELNKLK